MARFKYTEPYENQFTLFKIKPMFQISNLNEVERLPILDLPRGLKSNPCKQAALNLTVAPSITANPPEGAPLGLSFNRRQI